MNGMSSSPATDFPSESLSTDGCQLPLPPAPPVASHRGSSVIESIFQIDVRSSALLHTIGFDGDHGRKEFFIHLLFRSVGDSARLITSSVLVVVVWSIVCALASEWLRQKAASDHGGAAWRWIEDFEECKNAISIVGTLFVFTLVFRFNTCYDRWWEGRIHWSDIISKCLELALMTRSWVADDDLADRMSRFIVVFGYASKALLRRKSLNDEDGPSLVKRGLLTQEELDDMHDNPCWQPHYCLHMLRDVLVEVHSVPGGKGLYMDEGNKIHGQMFRCFDGTIRDMNKLVGNCVRLSASGLPASYDAITMSSFFLFYLLASPVWASLIGWLAPLVVFISSLIIMLLIVMGTRLVDPFGYDKVDIPLEAFCYTIEAQVMAIDKRAKGGKLRRLSKMSKPKVTHWKQQQARSLGHISNTLTARSD